MIKIENFEVMGWEHTIRGMRNPTNSWGKSDSRFRGEDGDYYDITGDTWPEVADSKLFYLGLNDRDLMLQMVKADSVDSKFRRIITACFDITAPLYWWKEFDAYKVDAISCSTMCKIYAKEFTFDDFSNEHLFPSSSSDPEEVYYSQTAEELFSAADVLQVIVEALNEYRKSYLETKDKDYWWQIIQLLPSSYNQKRTVMLNYEALANIYQYQRYHKLDEWRDFCKWIESLPYSKIITCNVEKES